MIWDGNHGYFLSLASKIFFVLVTYYKAKVNSSIEWLLGAIVKLEISDLAKLTYLFVNTLTFSKVKHWAWGLIIKDFIVPYNNQRIIQFLFTLAHIKCQFDIFFDNVVNKDVTPYQKKLVFPFY